MTARLVYDRLLRESRSRDALEHAGSDGSPEQAALPDPDHLIEALTDDVRYLEDKLGVHADPEALQRLTTDAERGLAALYGGRGAELGTTVLAGLEAVVHSDGSRPVLFVEDDFIDVHAPSAASFAASLSLAHQAVRAVCQAVGRVEDPAASIGYQGTAWAIDEGVVVTNYHVLQAISYCSSRIDSRWAGELKPGVAVDFGCEIGAPDPGRRFMVRQVLAVGRAGDPSQALPRPPGINFDGLDVAVLELEKVTGRSFPAPLTVARGDDPTSRGALASRGRLVYLVGFPGSPRSTTPDVFAKLFAGVKGVKRLTPGVLTQGRGEVEHDPRRWVVAHDASTLGGSSGSPVVDLEAGGRLVLGLHFAGVPGLVNWAHGLEGASEELSRAGVPGWSAP